MSRRQAGLAVVLILGLFIFFSGMWGPTRFGIGDAPSTLDGTDEYGFPLRYKQQPSGECDTPGCSDRITSDARLALNVATFVVGSIACVGISRSVRPKSSG